MEVAEKGDVSLLGEGATFEDWEKILDSYAESENDYSFLGKIKKDGQIKRLHIQYLQCWNLLENVLPFNPLNDAIKFLRSKGLKICASDHPEYESKGKEWLLKEYLKSIELSKNKIRSWISRIESLKNEFQEEEGETKKHDFYDVLAELHQHFPNAPEDIKLKLYLSYQKVIKRKIKDANSRRQRRSE